MGEDREELLRLAVEAEGLDFPPWFLLLEAQASTRLDRNDEGGTYVVE